MPIPEASGENDPARGGGDGPRYRCETTGLLLSQGHRR